VSDGCVPRDSSSWLFLFTHSNLSIGPWLSSDAQSVIANRYPSSIPRASQPVSVVPGTKENAIDDSVRFSIYKLDVTIGNKYCKDVPGIAGSRASGLVY
jgi:hypothetical protein